MQGVTWGERVVVKRFVKAFVAFVGLVVPGTFVMALLAAPPAKPPPRNFHSVAPVLLQYQKQDLTAAVDRSVKLAIGASGTTLSAGVSADPTTHNTLSADQKAHGPLHAATAITDAGRPTADKRVTAGFHLAW